MSLFEKLNLRQRFNILIFLGIVIAAALLIASIFKATTQYASEYTIRYWQDYTQTFANASLYAVVLSSDKAATSVIRNLGSNRNIRGGNVYDADHQRIASYGDTDLCQPEHGEFKVLHHWDYDNYWCFYAPVVFQNAYAGHVEIAVSKDDFKAVTKNLLRASIVIVLLFSLFIFLMVSHYSRLFTSSIDEIVQVLKSVGQGIRGRRVGFSGAADIDLMRDAFNDMLKKIEQNEQALEQLVASRTLELKLALDSSQAANSHKSQILALVTHDMKTPLQATINCICSVLDNMPETPEYRDWRDFLSRALTRTHDLNHIIENILLQGQLEADKYQLSTARIDIKPLILDSIERNTPWRVRNQNNVVTAGDEITVYSDEVALTHITNNLIENAFKFTVNGLISVNWSLSADILQIQVTDSGCGIATENYEKIFDHYWHEEKQLNRPAGGSGIGLAVTKLLVDRLNGFIDVKPNTDQGTVFTVRIPCLIS